MRALLVTANRSDGLWASRILRATGKVGEIYLVDDPDNVPAVLKQGEAYDLVVVDQRLDLGLALRPIAEVNFWNPAQAQRSMRALVNTALTLAASAGS